jgi:hypothetical protein
MIRLAASLFGMFSWALVAFFAVRFPAPDSLQAAPIAAAWSWGWLIILAGIIAWLFWMRAFVEGEGIFARKRYGTRILLSLLAQAVLTFLAASFLHRDFSSLFFQAAALHFGLFVGDMPAQGSRFYRLHADRLFVMAMACVGFFLCWIALMGYAIATRAEPRWIPSLGYNILNFGICGFVILANFGLKDSSRRELVALDSGLFLEGVDILPLFGDGARPIALKLASAPGGLSLSCYDIQAVLGGGQCDRNCGKAPACAEYRKAYSGVCEAGKLFLALRIGKISPQSRGRSSIERSWSFVPDSSVRIRDPKEGEGDAEGPSPGRKKASEAKGLSETASFR